MNLLIFCIVIQTYVEITESLYLILQLVVSFNTLTHQMLPGHEPGKNWYV